MSTSHFFIFIFLLPIFAITPITLKESFESAMKRSESPKIIATQSRQYFEKIEQARGNFLPRLSLIGTTTEQDIPSDQKNKMESTPYSLKLNGSQSLFRGFRDRYLLEVAELNFQAQKELEHENRLQIFDSISGVFYSILKESAELNILEEQQSLTHLRIKDLEERVKIGKSRSADLLIAKSQSATTNATIDALKTSLNLQKEHFSFLIGLSENDSEKMILQETPIKIPTPLPAFTTFLQAGGEEERPEIKALKQQMLSSQTQIKAIKSNFLPSIDLNYNYYIERSGKTKPSMWDVGVMFTWPLYEGGTTSSQLRESTERYYLQELLYQQAKRSLSTEVKILYEKIKGAESQLKALQKAIRQAEEAYQEQLKDYRYGLLSILDVLQMQNMLLETKKNHNKIRYERDLNWIQFQALTGDINL